MGKSQKKVNLHNNHRDNLRSSAVQAGMEAFEDHNLLELLLFNALPRRNTNDIAHKLLKSFGGLGEVLGKDKATIISCENAGEKTALFLNALNAVCENYLRDSEIFSLSFDTVNKARNYLYESLKAQTDAVVSVLSLNSLHEITKQVTCRKSELINNELMPETLKDLISNPCSFAFIAFTHPNGILAPDKDEIDFIYGAKNVFLTVGILLTEAVIVTNHGCRFLSETNIFPRNFFIGQQRP